MKRKRVIILAVAAAALALAIAGVGVVASAPAPNRAAQALSELPPGLIEAGPGHDGLSLETAIVIHASNETDGVGLEYLWLAATYPDDSLELQSLVMDGGRAYDVMELLSPDGGRRTVYFDITAFFGVW
jgi:hypothetical protein